MLSLTQVPRRPWLSGVASLILLATTGLWVLAHWVSSAGSSGWPRGAPRAPSSRVSKDLCFTHRSWLLPGLPLIVIPRGNGCLLRLEGCGYSACRQSSSQNLQLQGPWHSFSSVSCVPSPAWRVSCCAGHRQPSNIFFPLEKFSKYLPFLFLAVKLRQRRFPCDKADLESTQRLSTNGTSHLFPSLSPNDLFQIQVVSSLSDRIVILSVIIYKCKNGNIT